MGASNISNLYLDHGSITPLYLYPGLVLKDGSFLFWPDASVFSFCAQSSLIIFRGVFALQMYWVYTRLYLRNKQNRTKKYLDKVCNNKIGHSEKGRRSSPAKNPAFTLGLRCLDNAALKLKFSELPLDRGCTRLPGYWRSNPCHKYENKVLTKKLYLLKSSQYVLFPLWLHFYNRRRNITPTILVTGT